MRYLSEMHLYGQGVSVTPPVSKFNDIEELGFEEKVREN